MTLELKKLEPEDLDQYNDFLLRSPWTQLYASNVYRLHLKRVLKATDHYLCVYVDKKIMGVLPTFLKQNTRYGNVLNSLPFYGSHGGCIEHHGSPEIREKLIAGFFSFAREKKCLSATLVSSPFSAMNINYGDFTPITFQTARTGQITPLPQSSDEALSLLIASFSKCRSRNIRKAKKSGVTIRKSQSLEDLRKLYLLHRANLNDLGGIPKSWEFFRTIPEIYAKDDYVLYLAEIDNRMVAAVLLFYFNQTVEYFTPALDPEFRNCQPLSLALIEAMKNAISKGFKYWNWGGTWDDQTGVYDFKKRWGAQDHPYIYYTQVLETSILEFTRSEILQEFPNFFAVPFDRLLPGR